MTPPSSSLPVGRQLERSKTLKLPAKPGAKRPMEAEQSGSRDSKRQKQDRSPNMIEGTSALTPSHAKGAGYAHGKKRQHNDDIGGSDVRKRLRSDNPLPPPAPSSSAALASSPQTHRTSKKAGKGKSTGIMNARISYDEYPAESRVRNRSMSSSSSPCDISFTFFQ